MNIRNQCRFYDGCSAQLCPKLSDEENSGCIWYPDEDVCRLRKAMPVWVKQQRKIARKFQTENTYYYFTLAMLKIPFRVTKAVKGLNPDNLNEGKQLKTWFQTHKGVKRKVLTDEQLEMKRKTVAIARLARPGVSV